MNINNVWKKFEKRKEFLSFYMILQKLSFKTKLIAVIIFSFLCKPFKCKTGWQDFDDVRWTLD